MKKKSFTLIELMISISIMSFIFLGSFTLINKFKKNYFLFEKSLKDKKDRNRFFYLVSNDFNNSDNILIKQYNNKTILNIIKINDEFSNNIYSVFYILKENIIYRIKTKKNDKNNNTYFHFKYDIEKLLYNIEKFKVYQDKINNSLLFFIKEKNQEPFTFSL